MRAAAIPGLVAILAVAAVTFAADRHPPAGASPVEVHDCPAAPDGAQHTRGRRVGIEVPVALGSVGGGRFPRSAAPRLVRSDELHLPGASHVAPFFSRFDLAPGDFVIVRSPSGDRARRYEGLGKGDLGRGRGFWGIHIAGDRAVIEFHSRGGEAGRGYRIDRAARGIAGDPPNPICGADDKRNARCYEDSHPAIYGKGRAVARLLIEGVWSCTGWLLGDQGHLMTNAHCIGDQWQAMNTDYEFLAEGACPQACGPRQCPGIIAADQGQLIRADPGILDHALIHLEGDPQLQFGWLQLRPQRVAVGEPVYIPQHPLGHGKQIAAHSSHPADPGGLPLVQELFLPDIAIYYADINYGSSGSPVLGHLDHCVVALHTGTFGCEGSGLIGNTGRLSSRLVEALADHLPASAIAGPEGCLDVDRLFADGFEAAPGRARD